MENAEQMFCAVVMAIFVAAPVRAQTQTAQMDKPVQVNVGYKQPEQPVVLVFLANRCGVTWQYADKIAALQKRYAGKVTFIGVHSNIEETNEELVAGMRKHKLYLVAVNDKPTQELATYFGATVTPYFVVIDGKGVLRYRGAFDKMGGSIAESKRPQYLRPALDAILAGKPVANKTVRALGCEIARRKK